ncbi:MmgE/PrpD family protein [Roseospira visakhapatnamensis]|uniref:2-methylcitrate dehydratase PrpD n=1 Tax=Roseospira visakhapatnamensis TaxID=390880 RepID=A0A7W6RCZ7_9PROT|nr:MmgE/PrpD family protein [Roseospira visakhapatnamensis]MBB4265663.1 2-methylcitrate dehydratase PrpD [Roseospira visakhapatnamensis]
MTAVAPPSAPPSTPPRGPLTLDETADEPAARLAAFAARTRWGDIPAEVRVRAHHHVLDAVGIALASGGYEFARATLTATRGLGGDGPVPVIGLPAWLPARDAALVNGVLCHGLDFDDTHLGGVVHPTVSAWPAAMAAAVHAGASGEDMMLAYVIGVEATTRVGMAGAGAFHRQGFHPTGVAGVFGATLAAGRLFGLTATQLVRAQGIALSMASGSLEFLEDGGWTKRLHPGWVAAAGLTAAALAREGFTGATRPYDGRYGLFTLYLGADGSSADQASVTAGLGRTWELMNTAIKPYPACHFAHGCIDAALVLAARLAEQGMAASDIAQVTAMLPEAVIPVVCEPEANKKVPANAYDAQFSVPYLVAAALVRRRLTLAELDESARADPAIQALARRVSHAVDAETTFPRHYTGALDVRLADGRVLSHREALNRGCAERPLSNTDIIEKFAGNAATATHDARAERVRAGVLSFAEAPDARTALAVLAQPALG